MYFNIKLLTVLVFATAVHNLRATSIDNDTIPNYKFIGKLVLKNENDERYTSRYYLWNTSEKNRNEAISECAKVGGQLAMFETKAEQDFVLNALYVADPGTKYTTIGGVKKSNKWYTNWPGAEKEIDYAISWNSGEPNNMGGKENCMEIVNKGNTKKVNDIACEDRSRYFLCEKQDHIVEDENVNKLENLTIAVNDMLKEIQSNKKTIDALQTKIANMEEKCNEAIEKTKESNTTITRIFENFCQ